MAVIWEMLMVAQGRFYRLHAPELPVKGYSGVRYTRTGLRRPGRRLPPDVHSTWLPMGRGHCKVSDL